MLLVVRRALVLGAIVLVVALAAYGLGVAMGEAAGLAFAQHAPSVRVCPDPDDLAGAIAVSRDGRVYVLPESRSPIHCVSELVMLTRGLPRSVEVEENKQYYCSLLESSIEQLLAAKPVSTSLGDAVRQYGFDVLDVSVFDGRVAHVVVATSRPGGLGREFARLVAEAAAKTMGVGFETVFVSYTAPNTPYMMDELARRLGDFINASLERGITIAVGYDGYVPVVVVYRKAADLVGGVQGLADLVAESLPEGGWALLILREEPHRLYIQPKRLSETTGTATPASTTEAGQAAPGSAGSAGMAKDETGTNAPPTSSAAEPVTTVSTASPTGALVAGEGWGRPGARSTQAERVVSGPPRLMFSRSLRRLSCWLCCCGDARGLYSFGSVCCSAGLCAPGVFLCPAQLYRPLCGSLSSRGGGSGAPVTPPRRVSRRLG